MFYYRAGEADDCANKIVGYLSCDVNIWSDRVLPHAVNIIQVMESKVYVRVHRLDNFMIDYTIWKYLCSNRVYI